MKLFRIFLLWTLAIAGTFGSAAATSQYEIVNGLYTWHEAKADAEARGGHLATITTEVEFQFLRTNSLLKNGLWIGGTDSETEGAWKWITSEPWQYTRWNGGEPNGDRPDNPPGDHSSYLQLVGDGTVWNDAPSTLKMSYLFERGTNLDLRIEHAVQVSFFADSLRRYQIESSPEVEPLVWSIEGQTIVGAGKRSNTTFLTQSPKRIYRVQEVDIASALIAFYPFNGNANDESVSQNHATVFGATLTTNRFGLTNAAYQFNGSNQYLRAPHQTFLNFPDDGDFTISVWAMINNPEVGGIFVGKDNGGGDQPKWMFVAGGVPNQSPGMRIHFHINPTPEWFATPIWTPLAGRWYHFTVRKSGSLYSIFVDGALISTSTANGLISNQINAPLTIGQAEGGGWLNGQIDDVRIYARALSANDIKALNEIVE